MTITAKIERDGMVTRGVRLPSHQLTLKLFNMNTLEQQAKVLALNTWIGTAEELELRKAEYVAIRKEHGEELGNFWEILNNY